MDKKEKEKSYIEDYISDVKESLDFFSNKRKPEREKWVVNELLTYFKMEFKPAELCSYKDEPPDIIFRDAHFEIKEIQNNNRRRTDEYKNTLEKARKAGRISELLEQYTPINISIDGAFLIIAPATDKWTAKYGLSLCEKLDLLIYLNLRGTTLDCDDLEIIDDKDKIQGWRSISVVSNNCAFVISAAASAPIFLQIRSGKIFKK